MSFIPNVPPKIFTLSATVIGFILIDDTTAEEQNALGNWLMLVAQVLCTNGFYKQLQNLKNNNHQQMPSNEETLRMLQKMVMALNKEIEEIKKNL